MRGPGDRHLFDLLPCVWARCFLNSFLLGAALRPVPSPFRGRAGDCGSGSSTFHSDCQHHNGCSGEGGQWVWACSTNRLGPVCPPSRELLIRTSTVFRPRKGLIPSPFAFVRGHVFFLTIIHLLSTFPSTQAGDRSSSSATLTLLLRTLDSALTLTERTSRGKLKVFQLIDGLYKPVADKPAFWMPRKACCYWRSFSGRLSKFIDDGS